MTIGHDFEALVENLKNACPLRVRVGSLQSTFSPTGGEIPGAFVALDGHESIPAQRNGIGSTNGAKVETIDLASGQKATVTHIWTLPGAWPHINAGALLQEISLDDETVVEEYEILMSDVATFRIHTELKTRKVART